MKKSSFLVGGALLLSALFTTSCNEIMSNLDQPVSSYLTVNAADVTIPLDEGTYQIEASSINSDKPITYKSSNPEVATVDAKGIVTPLIEGETDITVAVEASENYNAGEQKVKIAVKQPLTFEAKKDGVIQVQFNSGFVPEKPIAYTINKGAKQEISSFTNINVKKGDKVQFESANETLTAGDGSWGVQIQPLQSCAVYGNVMSMISPDGNYHTQKAITKDYALKGLLCGAGDWELNPTTGIWECKELYTIAHDKYKLTLPATTLTKGCYNYMLAYTGLTETPELPATEIKDNAYQEMFRDCYELTESPAITAEVVGKYGCSQMFYDCSKLAKANAISVKTAGQNAFESMFDNCVELTDVVAVNAETMGEWACYKMFNNCAKLENVPATLPAENLANRCYSNMFAGCTSLKKAPALPATDLKSYCYNYMFGGCSALTEAPELKAATLAYACYNSMFYNCTKLSKVKCLATTNAIDAVAQWLYNAGTDESVTTRTLVRAEANTYWTHNDDPWNWGTANWYVPTGWTFDPEIPNE